MEMSNAQDQVAYRSDKSRRFISWQSAFALLFIIASLLAIVFLVLWINQRKIVQDLPCMDETCVRASADFLSSLDRSTDPCDNFFEYACKCWKTENWVRQRGDDPLTDMTKRSNNFIVNLLENSSTPWTGPGKEMIKVFYESCKNTTLINERGIKPMADLLVDIYDGWSELSSGAQGSRSRPLTLANFDLTDHLVRNTLHTYKTNPLFEISVINNIEHSSQMVLATMKKYKDSILKLPHYFGKNEKNLTIADKVYELEVELAKNMLKTSLKDPDALRVVTNLSRVAELCPIVDWVRFFNTLYTYFNHTITDDETVIVDVEENLQKRCQTMAEYLETDLGMKAFHTLTIINTINSKQILLGEDFQKMIVTHKAQEIVKSEKTKKRRMIEFCALHTNLFFHPLTDRLYIKENFGDQDRIKIEAMADGIRKVMRDRFTQTSWMTHEEEKEAVRKLDRIDVIVGYSAIIHDMEMEKLMTSFIDGNLTTETFFENTIKLLDAGVLKELYKLIIPIDSRLEFTASAVNAYYWPGFNDIVVPAGILSYPAFHSDLPESMIYGGIGSVIGHEFFHAFDETGSNYDSNANRRPWMSNSSRNSFNEKTQCLIDQYSKFSYENISLDGSRTLRENMADNSGVLVSYRAFEEVNKKIPYLPAMKYTPEQLFFLSFASLWCMCDKSLLQKQTWTDDPHALGPFRVLGTLRNMPQFAKAFNCPLGSPMNPVEKCNVW